MSHEGVVGRQILRGPPAFAMEAWSSAAQEAGIAIIDQSASSSAVALRQHNKIEMEQRAFGAIISNEAVESDSDESAHGHVKDADRDAARDDRTFARSTAKLTLALFAEMTGGSGFAARSARLQASTIVVSEVETAESEGAAAVAGMYASETADQPELQSPAGEPISFKPHRTP